MYFWYVILRRNTLSLCLWLNSTMKMDAARSFRHFGIVWSNYSRSQWPCGLRPRFVAPRLLRSWFRIPPGAWKFVCCECCVLSGRGLCDELITRPEESYRLWCVVVCDLETSRVRRSGHVLGRSATEKKNQTTRLHIQGDFNVHS